MHFEDVVGAAYVPGVGQHNGSPAYFIPDFCATILKTSPYFYLGGVCHV